MRLILSTINYATLGMTEQIEIEEGNNSQSQSDDDSGSDLGEGDVVEKEERRIYQPIEFDLNDPKNTFVIDFVSLQPEQQKVRGSEEFYLTIIIITAYLNNLLLFYDNCLYNVK